MSGVLYGIGVGPGDPELITLKGHRLIHSADVVAYPAPDTGPSLARAIAAQSIRPGTPEIPMIVPMRTDRFPAQEVYAQASVQIAQNLEAGRKVAVLCEGDPFFYGSFMYLFARLAADYRSEIVPGVSSLGGGAAALGQPLIARNGILSVLPGTLADEALQPRIDAADAVSIIKVGRHLPRLRRLVERMGLNDRASYVARASMEDQHTCPLSEAPEPAPYFSMILINKDPDPWLNPAQ